jgi:hypothetical protein
VPRQPFESVCYGPSRLKSRSSASSKVHTSDRHGGGHRCVPCFHYRRRGPGKRGVQHRNGPFSRKRPLLFAKPGSAKSAWVRFEVGLHRASTSAIRRLRFPASISAAKRSFSGPAPGRRALSPQAEPNGSSRFRRSRHRRPSAPFSRVHPIRSPWSQWARMASSEPTRTNSPQSTSRTVWKADRGVADTVRRLILAGGEVGRFHDPARPYLHPEDVDIALDINRFDFAVRVEFEKGRPVARMERPA